MANRIVEPWLVTFAGMAPGNGMSVGARLLPIANRKAGLYLPGQATDIPAELLPFAEKTALETLPPEARFDVRVLAATKLAGMHIVRGSDGRQYRVTIAIDRAD